MTREMPVANGGTQPILRRRSVLIRIFAQDVIEALPIHAYGRRFGLAELGLFSWSQLTVASVRLRRIEGFGGWFAKWGPIWQSEDPRKRLRTSSMTTTRLGSSGKEICLLSVPSVEI